MQIIFLSGTKSLWLPQYVNKFLVWHKKFGPAQNILVPVKGQGMNKFASQYICRASYQIELQIRFLLFFRLTWMNVRKHAKLLAYILEICNVWN